MARVTPSLVYIALPAAGFEADFTDQRLVCALVPFHVIAELQHPPPPHCPQPSHSKNRSLDQRGSLRIAHTVPFTPTWSSREPGPGSGAQRTGLVCLSLHGGDSVGTTSFTQRLPTYHIGFPLLPSQDLPRCAGRLKDREIGGHRRR